MASYQKQLKVNYPMGSISSGTMRPEDLIPTFVANLFHSAKVCKANGHFHTIGDVPAKTRKAHVQLVAEIEARMESDDYYESEDADYDLESLFEALEQYVGPYFYFGSHPGDGSDYGYWLSEDWDEDFISVYDGALADDKAGYRPTDRTMGGASIKVNDLAEVPTWFRGEVAVVNDHGNITLYVKTSRTLREVWSIV